MLSDTCIRWAELTDDERANFGNGCGPAWFPKAVTKVFFGWFFEASCHRHDFGYARGGSKADKEAVDKGFYKAMLRDAVRLFDEHKPFQFAAASVLATSYFSIVKLFGWTQFNYGPHQEKEALLKAN